MKKAALPSFLFVLILIIILAGCGAPAAPAVSATRTANPTAVEEAEQTATPAASTTTDACLSPQVEAEVQRVHRHMREFDDAAILASNMPREQLSDSIADLQRIRREAEDETIPACLLTLKTHQVDHMNSVIDTLVAFMGGTVDKETLDQSINVARRQHEQYVLELARLLGLTVVPVTVPVLSTPAETPTP